MQATSSTYLPTKEIGCTEGRGRERGEREIHVAHNFRLADFITVLG